MVRALDVGASDGGWAQELRRQGFAGEIASFEPHAASFARLERTAAGDAVWRCQRVALGAASGRTVLHVAGNDQSSSLLPMAARHTELDPRSGYVSDEEVTVERLDALVPPGVPTFLKLDVQGFELEVLHGAEQTLADTRVLEVELSVVPLYEGQALLPKVVQHLDGAGFELIGLETSFRDRRTGDLLQLNGLFRARAPRASGRS